MKKVYTLCPEPHPSRSNCIREIQAAPDGYIVEIKEPTRTTEQNAKMWAMLSDVSNSVEWYGQRLSQEEWKHVFTASLVQQKVIPGLDGGFVVCGLSTRKLSSKVMSDLIEVIYAFGSERKVKWTESRDRADSGLRIRG